ncbi:PH domain-containing protein [Blastococcus sp. LR1]|uniref:PH domain-containing protein n=1 Tax=Blastococcus sp. LR1 TaxID=2877000 RepID=UPI001CC9E756|nr:PH domain-containing protein [Blastococcus sp. LR1]MCA0146152.1 PH domain-containing protein [Blastococcus sp. LR1]
MSDVTAPTASPSRVWRVSRSGRIWVAVIAGLPTLAALTMSIQALVHLSSDYAIDGLAAGGTAAVLWLGAWWVALRPRLVLTADEVTVVNPWSTRHVPLADVVTVAPGFAAARVQLRSGSSVAVWALADVAGALSTRGRRAREAASAIAEAQHRAGLR